jgi:dTDP-glucose pyrophosphorylase
MLNVLLPMAGISPLAEELGYPYPSPLVEICGIPLIQRVIENLAELGDELCITAVLRSEDCRRFHLDSTIKLLAGSNTQIVSIQKDTAGALCSVLMAIEHINNDIPLVIANTDQIFDRGILRSLMQQIEVIDPDAACPTFDSVHPRWSCLRFSDNRVIEAVEKNPVSRHAVAGLYYFKSGRKFAESAMRAILNGRDIDGRFFISAVLNEYILEERTVVSVPVDGASYHSFFTAQRVVDYEHQQRNVTIC